MAATPVFRRFENTHPPHFKFYELELELSLFYPKQLVRRWGRIGAKPRSLAMEVATPEELDAAVEEISRLRLDHEYELVREA